MSLLQNSNAVTPSGFDIDQSLYIGDSPDSTPKISRTLTAAGSTNPKWTFATWFKKGGPCTGAKNFYWVDGVSWADMQLQISNDRANSTNAAGLVWAGSWFWDTSLGAGGLSGEMSFRDFGGWTHLCHVIDYNTSPNVWVYVNGVLQDPTGIYNIQTGAGYATNYSPVLGDLFRIGSNNSGQLAGMYFAHTYWIEQQALNPVGMFGEIDSDTGQFVPTKYQGTYSGNSFFLDYADAADLGKDQSGLDNDFTITSIAARQQCADSPTNNFPVLNSALKQAAAGSGNWVKNGARMMIMPGTDCQYATTIPLVTGKWYCEFMPGSGNNAGNGVSGDNDNEMWNGAATPQGGSSHIFYWYDGNKNIDGTATSYGDTYTNGDIIGMALNLDDSKVTFYKNNVSQGEITFTGNIINAHVFIPSGMAQNGNIYFNGGTDSTFFDVKTAQNNPDANGYGDFYYTPPAGYLAICTKNLPDPSIKKPSEYFNSILYTGDGGTDQEETGVGFQPDLVWGKRFTDGKPPWLFDSVRGVEKLLESSSIAIQSTQTDMLNSFDSDGFTHGNQSAIGGVGNYIAWSWKAGGAPTATNSAGAGNVPTSGSVMIDGSASGAALAGTTPVLELSANTTSGFSIGTYLGDGSNATLAHGLSKGPELVIVKAIVGSTYNWTVGWGDFSDYMHLDNNAAAVDDAAFWYDTPPSASVISIGANGNLSSNGDTYVFYAWHSVAGYSQVGSYTGDANVDGTYVYTGFSPKYVMVKAATTTGHWAVMDSVRYPHNTVRNKLYMNNTDGVITPENIVDFDSNGFKWRNTDSLWNGSYEYIYLALAETPFKTANAR